MKMRHEYYRPYLIMVLVLISLAAVPLAAQASPCSNPFVVVQPFPTSGLEQTRWQVSGCSLGNFGLVVGPANFRKAPSSPLIKVLHDARVSEILVPYHTNSARFFDISVYSIGLMLLGDAECPPSKGTRLASNRVCKEVRDRGLAWKDDTGARRGQELVLWGVIQAVNYKYVIEWTFRDDGVILGRVGPTGNNLPTKFDVTHMHTISWRLDIDLNGGAGDSVRRATHTENGTLTATDTESVISLESGQQWSPANFTTWNIYDLTLKNSQGKRSSYHLIPLRSGTARHFDSDEAYTKNDFWVTRYPGSKTIEVLAKNLPLYVSPAQSVVDTDIIVWYTGSLHHIERDEDDNGPTHVLFVGFMLKPHDLFDASPLR